jgi:hypothetical protein
MPPALMFVIQHLEMPDAFTGEKTGMRGAMRSMRAMSGG